MWNLVQIKTPYKHFSAQICCRFLNLYWFKNTNQSWMQTSRRCRDAFLTCNRASCFTRDVMHHHHWCVSSWVKWLRMHHATTSLAKKPFVFFIFLQCFSPEWPIRTCSNIIAVLLLCTDDENRSYRNVCSMSFVSFALAALFFSIWQSRMECNKIFSGETPLMRRTSLWKQSKF